MSVKARTAGRLYVVATPIGNLEDMAPRACQVLDTVDLVAAEDTRHSGRLLAHLGLKKPLVSLHEHNETQVVPDLIRRLQEGENMALISDAGTPLISDPGFVLLRAARQASLTVLAVPGPCAVTATLSICGLPTDRFVFEGFLPSRGSARRRYLQGLAEQPRTLVFFESSHRIAECAADIVAVFGAQRGVCLARELSKLHEQSVTLPAGALPGWLAADDNRRRGEFVLVVAGAEPGPPAGHRVALDALLRELLVVMPVAQAAKAAARLTDAPRNQVYQRALTLGRESN